MVNLLDKIEDWVRNEPNPRRELIKIGVLSGSLSVLIMAPLLTLFYFAMSHEYRIKNEAYIKVEKRADLNLDGKVDNIEWAKVYDTINLEWNPLYSRPLEVKDMERYLEISKKVK